MSNKCDFCKNPCGNEWCSFSKTELESAKKMTKALIPHKNHTCWEDRERILKKIEKIYAHITRQENKH